MKKSELRLLIAEYKKLKSQMEKGNSSEKRIDKIKEIEHRYFHETGRDLVSDLNQENNRGKN